MPAAPAYPPDLADLVLAEWPSALPLGLSRDQLAEVLSVCFLASLTTDEGRPVRFRLLLTPPEALPEGGEPNQGALRLRFDRPRRLAVDELRRLSPAVPFETSLIGAFVDSAELKVWGIAHSGAAWLAPSWGGRAAGQVWTDAAIVHVTGPGRIAVRTAGRLVAGLERGALMSSAMDVFDSAWLPRLFEVAEDELRREADNCIEASLLRTISQHMVRRVVRLIRGAGHGGMILFAEPEASSRFRAGEGLVRLKYCFAQEEPQRRYRTLLRRLMRSLGELSVGRPVGWAEFRDAADPLTEEIERSIFELSRLVASLASTDGAVLLDKRFDLVGFGAEVSAEVAAPSQVWRAIDVEAEQSECDLVESVGTRHRAAYRFVQNHPQGLAIVISHDGAVRFVAKREEGVTYWEQSVSP